MDGNFQRQLFIADLFRPKQIINAFDYVEFNSIDAFKKAVKMDLYNIKKGSTLQINLRKYDDFRFMLYLYKIKKNLFTEMNVNLLSTNRELTEEILSKKIPADIPFTLLVLDSYNTGDYWKTNSDWIRKNKICLIYRITADTIATDICQILEYYNTNNIRFFVLDIDYLSFMNHNLSELPKFEFWFSHLRTWVITNDNKRGNTQPIVLESMRFHRRIFVDDDLTLYLDAYKDDKWSFPLLEHLEDTGETMNTQVLNRLHKYLDLTPQAIYTNNRVKNWLLIPYGQIIRMGHFINELPIIVQLVQRWLYNV